jgi:uncharacterized repeat protein (TIGR01451 family)
MRTRSLGRWSAVAVATTLALGGVLAAVVVADAPANNRSPSAVLSGLPGPTAVTYGKNIAYTATLENTGQSMFTKVQFSNPIPTTTLNGETYPATFKYASCPGTLTATAFVCDEIHQLGSGETARVTIVWGTPGVEGSSSAGCQLSAACLTNRVVWTIKEGTGKEGSAGPDTFVSNTVETELLVVPDAQKAGGYPLSACTDPASQTTLQTNPSVGAGNPIATRVCAPKMPENDVFNPGLVVVIEEGAKRTGEPGITDVSEICIPSAGATCPSSTSFSFDTSAPATFTFTIANSTLPRGVKITKVFHDGVLVSTDPDDFPHVQSIRVDNRRKITTVVVKALENGRWGFG